MHQLEASSPSDASRGSTMGVRTRNRTCAAAQRVKIEGMPESERGPNTGRTRGKTGESTGGLKTRDRFETDNAQTPRKTDHHPGPEDKARGSHSALVHTGAPPPSRAAAVAAANNGLHDHRHAIAYTLRTVALERASGRRARGRADAEPAVESRAVARPLAHRVQPLAGRHGVAGRQGRLPQGAPNARPGIGTGESGRSIARMTAAPEVDPGDEARRGGSFDQLDPNAATRRLGERPVAGDKRRLHRLRKTDVYGVVCTHVVS